MELSQGARGKAAGLVGGRSLESRSPKVSMFQDAQCHLSNSDGRGEGAEWNGAVAGIPLGWEGGHLRAGVRSSTFSKMRAERKPCAYFGFIHAYQDLNIPGLEHTSQHFLSEARAKSAEGESGALSL